MVTVHDHSAGVHALGAKFANDVVAQLIGSDLAQPAGFVTQLCQSNSYIALSSCYHLGEGVHVSEFCVAVWDQGHQTFADRYYLMHAFQLLFHRSMRLVDRQLSLLSRV